MAHLSLTLTQYEDAIDKLQIEVSYGLHMGDEMLSMFPPVEVTHRGTARIVSTPTIYDSTMKFHKTKDTIETDIFLQTDALKFRETLMGINNVLQDQVKMQMWDTIFKTAEAAGQSIDGQGRNFWEAYIETLEMLDFKFDEQGKHNYRFMLNSNTAKKIMAVPPTEDQIRRMKEVIDAKRAAFFANRRSRRLS